MRIIGGKYKSRLLTYPRGITTRPTKDNIRLAIFNILQTEDFSNQVVLDLFAGSGAYGIEALSRGAAWCYFNDNNYQACMAIKRNLNTLNITNAQLLRFDFHKCLAYLLSQTIQLDLVFLDPPFQSDYYYEALLLLSPLLNLNSVIVLEQDYKLQITLPSVFTIIKEKRYGNMKILFLKKEV